MIKNITMDILIVEDHSLTRFGLKTAIESLSFVNQIHESENGEQALQLVKEYAPDIVLLDLGLPDIDGIQVAKSIKEINKSSKIIILTSHSKEEEVLAALKAGANAYCLKDIEPDRLMQIIETVYEGAAWFDPNVADYVLQSIQQMDKVSEMQESNSNCDLQLTDREKEVLKLIVDGYTNADISDKLCVTIHTAKAHVCNILHKLSVDDRTQAAIKALKHKIV